MKLTELLELCWQSSSDEKTTAIKYIKNSNIDEELPGFFADFILRIKNKEPINQQEFSHFSQHLSTYDKDTQRCITHLIHQLSSDIYNEFKAEIESTINSIESNLKAGKEVPNHSLQNPKKYLGLLNCYRLFSSLPREKIQYSDNRYPSVNPIIEKTIHYNLPFAINALRIVGKLPISADFNGFNLSKPYYPLHLQVVKKEKALLKKGVKRSDEYYPYRMVAKINPGTPGDSTFTATNGKKMLFIRGIEYYNPNGILASKIANLVSPKHFSSERLLDNHLAGSKALPGYALSLADESNYQNLKRFIQEGRVFPGSGFIDEVTNFVSDEDVNIENYGSSSPDIAQSYLTKIDFGWCDVLEKKTKESYEKNNLTKIFSNLAHEYKNVQNDYKYINEKLVARLKLSLLTKPIISTMAEKAFTSEDIETKDEAIEECVNRINIALALFIDHPQASAFLAQNPSALDECYREIKHYIETHFEEEIQESLQSSLKERLAVIKNEVHMKLALNFNSSNQLLNTRPVKEFALEDFSNCSTALEVEEKYAKFCRELDNDKKISPSQNQEIKKQLSTTKSLKLVKLSEFNKKILEGLKHFHATWKVVFDKKNTPQEVEQSFQAAQEELKKLTNINKINKIKVSSKSLEEFKIAKSYNEALQKLTALSEKRIKDIKTLEKKNRALQATVDNKMRDKKAIQKIITIANQCPNFTNSFSIPQCDNEEVTYIEQLNEIVQNQTNNNNQLIAIYRDVTQLVKENKNSRMAAIKSTNEKIISDLQPKLAVFHEKIRSISKQNQRYAKAAEILWTSLGTAQIKFVNAELTGAEFRNKCLEAINIAKPVLQEHRGFLDQLLNKLFEAFGFHSYSRFRPTDSLMKANELMDEINQYTKLNQNL